MSTLRSAIEKEYAQLSASLGDKVRMKSMLEDQIPKDLEELKRLFEQLRKVLLEEQKEPVAAKALASVSPMTPPETIPPGDLL